MNDSKVKKVIAWGLQIFLAVAYLLAASGKLLSRSQVIEMFSAWGFPDRFYFVIGVFEIFGAIGLLIPRTSSYAATGLIILMIGAVLTHLVNGEGWQALRPIVFILLLAVVLLIRRPRISKLSEGREDEQEQSV